MDTDGGADLEERKVKGLAKFRKEPGFCQRPEALRLLPVIAVACQDVAV